MIIDDLSVSQKYYKVHPLFRIAFEQLQSLEWHSISDGIYELDGDNLFYIVTDMTGIRREAASDKFECHDKYIDIHLCIRGVETFGWKPRKNCIKVKDSRAALDYICFDETPDMYFHLIPNQFVVFFPDDVHAPMIGEEKIKKVVVKVKVLDGH